MTVKLLLYMCAKSLVRVEPIVRVINLGIEKQILTVDGSLDIDCKKVVEAFRPHILIIDDTTVTITGPAREVDPNIRFLFRSWGCENKVFYQFYEDSNRQTDSDGMSESGIAHLDGVILRLMHKHPDFQSVDFWKLQSQKRQADEGR